MDNGIPVEDQKMRVKNSGNMAQTRREFLKATALTAGALAFPTILPSSVFGAEAPSNRITIGCIGVRNKGIPNMREFMKDAQVVALCDVDAGNLAKANEIAKVDAKSLYGDFRELISRKDIDAVLISTPDQWHAIPSIAAMRAGKDVYCEKPLTLTIAEGRAMADAARQTGRILQTGSQQRSDGRFRRACELVRSGLIGKTHTVVVEIPGNNIENPMDWKEEPVPAGFDYNFWLGQAPQAPYTHYRCHYNFRFILDYSGGQMTNWGAHYLDIAQWGLGTDDTGPVRIDGKGEFPKAGLFTTATKADLTYTYANGVRIRLKQPGGSFTRFEGDKGWIQVSRSSIKAEPASILEYQLKDGDVRLYESSDHVQNFLDCVKSRKAPIADAEIGHRSATLCHLGNIAMLLGRPLQWDPKTERFVNDAEADKMIRRTMRAPWGGA